MGTTSLSIRRNTTFNVLGAVIPLVLSLVTIPAYLHLIGEARYGVLAIAWVLLGYFGLFDLGLGRATAQRIAALRNAKAEERAQVFWTALILNLALGVIGALLLWPVATYFFKSHFHIATSLRSEMISAVPWLILALPVATLSGVLTGTLQGLEEFFELNLISALSTTLFQLFPLATAGLLGPELFRVLPAAILGRLICLGVLLWRCHQNVFKGFRPTFVRCQAGGLARFGGWVTITGIVSPLMETLDRFMIGVMTGATAVTFYTVPYQLVKRTTILPAALSRALFPRLATSLPDTAHELAEKGIRALMVVMTPMVILGTFLIKPFLEIWLSEEFAAHSTLVAQLLLFGFWANSLARIPFVQLQACGRPDLVAKCHLFEALPYFGLLYVGLNKFGLAGAAVAFSVRVFVDYFLLAAFAGLFPLAVKLSIVPLFLLAGSLLVPLTSAPGSMQWFVMITVYFLITITWAWRQSPAPIRDMVLNRIRPLIN